MNPEFKSFLVTNSYVDINTRHGYKIRGKIVNVSKYLVEIECIDNTIVIMKISEISILRIGTKEQVMQKPNKPILIGSYDYKTKPKKKAKKK